MSVLFLLDSASKQDDVFRYCQMLIENLPAEYDPKLIFATEGAPSDMPYQLLKQYVATRLCFTSNNGTFDTRLASFIERNNIETVVVFQSSFGGTSIVAALNHCKNKPKLVFVGADCSQNCKAMADEVAAYSNVTYVSMSTMITDRYLKEYDPLVIYGAAVMPKSSGVNIRKEFGIDPKSKVIGFIGNVDDFNIGKFVESARRIDAGILVAGIGNTVTELSEVNGPVKVVPTLPEFRADWYRAFDVLCYPVNAASFPSIPLEAAMCNTPVAMTPVSDFYRLFGEFFSFFGTNVTQMSERLKEAMSTDMNVARVHIAEEFSIERMIAGWSTVM